MKKTLTINLNGIVFHIDDDAYQMLQDYITNINTELGNNDEAKEIIADIEARIAELFTTMLLETKQEVVNVEMVVRIIKTMGNPAEFVEADTEENPKTKQKKQSRNKRFYRDIENQLVGGVAAGVAAYLGWDTIIIRILLVVFLIIGWWATLPFYILLWIIAPAAETAAQRLEMRGEDATIENIKREFNNAKNYVENEEFKAKAQSVGQQIMQGVVRVLKIALTLGAAFLGIIVFVIITILCIALFSIIFGFGAAFSFLPLEILSPLDTPNCLMVVFMIALIFVITIPILNLLLGLIKYIRTKKGLSKLYTWSTLCIWIVALVILFSIGFRAWVMPNGFFSWHTNTYTNTVAANTTANSRTIDGFHTVVVVGNIHLTLVENPTQILTVESADLDLADVKTEVQDSVLYISINNMYLYDRVDMYIPSNTVRKITTAGACVLHTQEKLHLPVLDIQLMGASKAKLNLHIDSLLSIQTAGASYVELAGFAQQMDVRVMGASKLSAYDLKTNSSKVHCAGGSKVELWCETDLRVQAYGASTVKYKGNPNVLERVVVGASSIKKF